MSFWLEKELELNRKYDELLQRREALLRGTERYFDSQMKRSSSFVSSYIKAKERNEHILKCLEELSQDIHQIQIDDTPKFRTVKKNYSAMMKELYPLWRDEIDDRVSGRRNHTPSPPPGRRPSTPNRTPRSRTPSPSQKSQVSLSSKRKSSEGFHLSDEFGTGTLDMKSSLKSSGSFSRRSPRGKKVTLRN